MEGDGHMWTRTSSILALAAIMAAGCGGTVKTRGDAPIDTSTDGWPDTLPDAEQDVPGEEEPECGDERTTSSPIVNGTATWDPAVVALTDGQALAVGALMTQGWGGDWSNSCTATLVAPTLVITAAHCVRSYWGGDMPASSFRFAVGDDIAVPLFTWQPVEARSNPAYDGTARNDVAALVLPEPATVWVPSIQPIPMNCSDLDPAEFPGDLVQNAGYGQTETGWDPPPNTRRWWTVEEVVDLASFEFTVDGHGVSSVCYGDSGGPSLWTMPDGVVRVVGTVSWGDESCVDQDHFARVDDSCTFLAGFTDECGEITEGGMCDGNVARYCEAGVIVEEDCALSSMVCGDDGTGRMRCIEDPCGGVTWEGRCEGSNAVWCEDGEIRTRYCDECGQVCGWAESLGAYYCIDPD